MCLQPPPVATLARGHSIQPGSLAIKYFPIIAAALVASLGACRFKDERTVQPAPAAVVATPAPGTVVYTDPAPATATTTVYTEEFISKIAEFMSKVRD
jgi:hypothetical protein